MLKPFYSLQNLNLAWQAVLRKNSAGGVDGRSVQMFRQNAQKELAQLAAALEANTWLPDPAKRLYIPKNNNEKRPIGLATVRDKIVQTAVKNAIEPTFEKQFLPCSFAYRPGRGHHNAIDKTIEYLKSGHTYIATCDIDNFFDSLDHDLLMRLVREQISDARILRLIEAWLKIGAIHEMKWIKTAAGVPQGGVISPLLANLYLHAFDEMMMKLPGCYLRYADDFIIFNKDAVTARAGWLDAKKFLAEKRKLKLNYQKEPVRSLKQGFTFLGIFFLRRQRCIDRKKMRLAKQKISALCYRGRRRSLHAVVKSLNESIRGWRYYYKLINTRSQLLELERETHKQLARLLIYRLEHKKLRSFSDAGATLAGLQTLYRKSKTERQKDIAKILQQAQNLTRKESGDEPEQENRNRMPMQPQPPDISAPLKSPTDLHRDIKRRQQRYRRRLAGKKELLITQQNATLTAQFENLRVRGYRLDKKISIFQLQQVTITSEAVNITTAAIRLCMLHKVPIDILNFKGEMEAQIVSPALPRFRLVKFQIMAVENEKAAHIAKNIVLAKVRNQYNLMKYTHKYQKTTDDGEIFDKIMKTERKQFEDILHKIKILPYADMPGYRNKLLGYEGSAAVSYWRLYKALVEKRFPFPGRQHRGARDPVNAMLNYLYAILYSRVLGALQQTGLSPYISYLHVARGKNPSLAFDLIEEFRAAAADRVLLQLLGRNEPLVCEKGRLDQSTCRLLAQNMMQRLHTPFAYKKKEITLLEQIDRQAGLLARYLQGKSKRYKSFVPKW